MLKKKISFLFYFHIDILSFFVDFGDCFYFVCLNRRFKGILEELNELTATAVEWFI